MATAHAISIAMRRQASESGADVRPYISSVEDRGRSRGHYVSLLGDSVLCAELPDGRWRLTGTFGFERFLPADMSANTVASAVIACLHEDDEAVDEVIGAGRG